MNSLYHTPISFMHNYFIFRKREQVNAKRVSEAFIKNEGVHTAIQEHLSGAAGAAGAAATEKVQPIEAATTSAPAKAKARVKSAVSEPKADKPKVDKPKADKPK